MSTHWQDLRTHTGRWLGLELTVGRRPRPSWRLEAAPPCLRLVREGRPLLWARIAPYYQGVQWLLGSEEESSPLPPLQAREVDSVHEVPLSEPWFEDWARSFARALDASPLSPLHEGTWHLKRVFPFSHFDEERRGPPAEHPRERVYGVTTYPRQRFAVHVHWGSGYTNQLTGLKHPSRLSPSRLKVWRKRAREGTLPPVLILNVSPLDGFVVLDGHHRWMAALEEQRPVPLLALWSVRPDHRYVSASPEAQRRVERIYHQHSEDGGATRPESERKSPRPISVERLNELALDAWNDRPDVYSYTRGWPIPGGRQTWSQEVRARLAELGSAAPSEVQETMLDGL